jgi:hypothetical protein
MAAVGDFGLIFVYLIKQKFSPTGKTLGIFALLAIKNRI